MSIPKLSKNVILPLKLYNLEGKYASSLYSAAVKSESLTQIESEVAKVAQSIDRDNRIKAFLLDPTLSRPQKKKQVLSIMESGKYSKILTNFFSLMADNGRLALSRDVLGAFLEIMKAHRKEVSVIISSAKELDSKTLEKFKTLVVDKFVPKGSVPKVEAIVQPKLLGGIILEIGDKTIDMSVASKINHINSLLNQPI